MKQIPKKQQSIVITTVVIFTATVVWLWVGMNHSDQQDQVTSGIHHQNNGSENSMGSDLSNEEVRRAKAERLANWKANFPWNPTHDPKLTFDASQPYRYLLTLHGSTLSPEEQKKISQQWYKRSKTERSIGYSHWYLRGFFQDDIRFTPQFEKFYQILKEHGRGHNPAIAGRCFGALRVYYSSAFEHEPDEYYTVSGTRIRKERFGYMTWGDEAKRDLDTLRWYLSHWDWLRPHFGTEAGKAEVEGLINRLLTEIPDLNLVQLSSLHSVPYITEDSPQFQALVNGEEKLLTPYVGWIEESTLLEAVVNGRIRIHDESILAAIQKDPESNPPARIERSRLVDHWGNPLKQCEGLKVSMISEADELVPLTVDVDGFVTIPTPEEIERMRQNGHVHPATCKEASPIIQKMVKMKPLARKAEVERLTNWMANFPWKPTHDPMLTFDPSQPYLYLHSVSGSRLTPEEEVKMDRQWGRRSNTEWDIGPNHAFLTKFFEDDYRFSPQFELFCNILKEHDRGRNPVMVGHCFWALRQYFRAAFEHEPSEYLTRGDKRVRKGLYGYVTWGEEAEKLHESLRGWLRHGNWLNPKFSTEIGKAETEGLITRLLSEIPDLDELPLNVMSYGGSLSDDSPEFKALMNGQDKLLTPYVGWFQESALKEVEENRKFRIDFNSADPAIKNDPKWSPPSSVMNGQLLDSRGDPVGNFEGLKVTMINRIDEHVPLIVDEDGRVTIPPPSEVERMRQKGLLRKATVEEREPFIRFMIELGKQAQQGRSNFTVKLEDFE